MIGPGTNNTFTIEQVISFVREQTGAGDIKPGTDIFGELGCTGSDFDALIKKYKAKFQVDMSAYLWYFHNNEEGQNIGSIFFKPPNERVERIPVTPEMLLAFANSGRWDIFYPEHQIPSARLDYLINIILFFAAIFLILYVAVKK